MCKVFVIGNEKGGAGKTTFAMHFIVGLMDRGYKVSSIDTDSRQQSLSNYINNRVKYVNSNPSFDISIPVHFHITESTQPEIAKRDEEQQKWFEEAFTKARANSDYIIIDTPGSHSFLSKLAHSYANTIITPMNDSFLDMDVMAKIDSANLSVKEPSIYSQMIWEQKMLNAQRGGQTIDWIVLRNRLSNLDAVNKRNVNSVLEQLSKRIGFKIAPGFSERVIFRELFLDGLTLIDLPKINYGKSFNLSHVAARQELRKFFDYLGIGAANKV